jgi:hypothetical protein
MSGQRKRDGIDETAKQIVLDAYREGCRARSPKPFDEALKRYLRRYPHVKKPQLWIRGEGIPNGSRI